MHCALGYMSDSDSNIKLQRNRQSTVVENVWLRLCVTRKAVWTLGTILKNGFRMLEVFVRDYSVNCSRHILYTNC